MAKPETPVESLTREEAAAELARLAKEIAIANIAYHQKDAPEMTDAEFDALTIRNAEIEARFPDLVRATTASSNAVGAPPAEGFAKVRHAVPMLSLAKAYTDQDVVDFIERGQRFFARDKDFDIAFTSPSPRSTVSCRPRCVTRTASSCRARRAATARWGRISPPTSRPSRTSRTR